MLTKIKLRVGNVEIEYEGPDTFLYERLPTLIAEIQKTLPPETAPPPVVADIDEAATEEPAAAGNDGKGNGNGNGHTPLPEFLEDHEAGSSQWRRFLATSLWLHEHGRERLLAGEVATTLREGAGEYLRDPGDCLSQNVRKGFCRRDGSTFFVTHKGRSLLG